MIGFVNILIIIKIDNQMYLEKNALIAIDNCLSVIIKLQKQIQKCGFKERDCFKQDSSRKVAKTLLIDLNSPIINQFEPRCTGG